MEAGMSVLTPLPQFELSVHTAGSWPGPEEVAQMRPIPTPGYFNSPFSLGLRQNQWRAVGVME